MTSLNGNIFCITGPLCGEFTGHRWIPHTKASVTELWCFLCLNKRLSKQSWGWWFETPSRSLSHHCNEEGHRSDFKVTTGNPYLTPICELWCTHYNYFWANLSCYNGNTLYISCICEVLPMVWDLCVLKALTVTKVLFTFNHLVSISQMVAELQVKISLNLILLEF